MSEFRNRNEYGPRRDEDDRRGGFGSMNEREARRRSFYGERDDYGEWDREAYGRTQSETGYGRERPDADRYRGGDPTRGRASSSFGGAYDDRFDRGSGGRGGDYGSDRFGRRGDGEGARSPYAGYGGRGERYGQAAGYGSADRGRGDDAYRGEERGFIERAGDEIASWFGDHDAERRREADRRFGGRGPKGYTRSDERIHDDVNDRLTDDHYVDASDVEVAVKDREVTLSGHVPTRDQKRRAEDLAERVSGVSHVQNNLRVQTGTGGLAGTGSTTTSGSAGVGSAGSEIGGPRGWNTDTTGRPTS